MNFFSDLKDKIGGFILNNKIKKHKRETVFNNFKTAKSVAILFNAAQQDTYLAARNFIADLRKRDLYIKALGHVNTTEAIEYFDPTKHDNIQFFSIKNNNWHNMPLAPCIKEFLRDDYDILINLCMEDSMPILYITGLCSAGLKIGKGESGNEIYDISIDVKEGNTPEYFIDQIEHYLSVLQKG